MKYLLLYVVVGISIVGCKSEGPSDDCPDSQKDNGLEFRLEEPEIGKDYLKATSYGEIDVNPDNPYQIVTGKAVWSDSISTEHIKYGIVVLDLVTGEETWLVEGINWRFPRWGKQGWIVFENMLDKQLYIIRPNGDGLQMCTNPAVGGRYHNPSWIAEGQNLLSTGTTHQGISRVAIISLTGEVEQESLLSDENQVRTKFGQYADWREDSLISSWELSDRQALTVLTYPDLKLVKEINVIDSESSAAILHQEWLPKTDEIFWLSRGIIYSTNYITEETSIVWQDCELPVSQFSLMPNGKEALCVISQSTIREDLGGLPQVSSHLYRWEIETGVMDSLR